MRWDAVVFDLDGTLLDTLKDIADACNRALGHVGCPTHAIDAYRYMVGEGADVLLRKALPPDRLDRVDEGLASFKSAYDANAIGSTRPYEGITDLLNELVRRGLKLAVLTNKPHDTAQIVIQNLLGRYPWRAVLGHRDGVPKKPDPTAAVDLAVSLDARPDRCAFVGDTKIDMQTAVAAGMTPVGVSWGFRKVAELREYGATIILDHPTDLLPYLD